MRVPSRYLKIFGVDDMIMGGLSLAGGLMNNMFASSNADKTNQFNAQQAQLNRDFQERMSNTAYQRGMEDMKKAGLNPILAYQRGGASAPSGSSASGVTAATSDFVSPAVSSAQHSKRLNAEVDNMVATNDSIRAQTELLKSQSMESAARFANINTDTVNKEVDTKIKNAAVSEALKNAKLADMDKEMYDTPMGRIARGFGVFGREIAPAINSGRALIGR